MRTRGIVVCGECGETIEVEAAREAGATDIEDAGWTVIDGPDACPSCAADDLYLLEVDS